MPNDYILSSGKQVAIESSPEVGRAGQFDQRVQLVVDGSVASLTNPIAIVNHRGVIAVVTEVASSTSSVTLLPINIERHNWLIYNESTAILYLKFGTGASTTSFTVQIPANSYYESPAPTFAGIVTGVWASVNGTAHITETE